MLEIPEEGQVGTWSHKVCYALPGKAMAIYTYIQRERERERERDRGVYWDNGKENGNYELAVNESIANSERVPPCVWATGLVGIVAWICCKLITAGFRL